MNGRRLLRAILRRCSIRHWDPYAHMIVHWQSIPDVELSRQVLASEPFSGHIEPAAMDGVLRGRWTVVAPHGDDEAIGAGGTLLKAAAAGCSICVIHVFQDEPDSEGRADRELEADAVCRVLRAERVELGVSNKTCVIGLETLERLRDTLLESAPDRLLVPWPLDSPPKHRLANHIVMRVGRGARINVGEVWCYQVHSPLLATGYVDITAHMRSKQQLIRMFASQLAKNAPYDHIATGLAAWNSRLIRGIAPRYVELFSIMSWSDYLDIVEHLYLPDLEQTYRGNRLVLEAARSIV